MKRLLLGICIALGVFMITPPPTADAMGSDFVGRWGKGKDKPKAVPEFDPSSAGSAIVLLLGSAALILSRRREDERA